MPTFSEVEIETTETRRTKIENGPILPGPSYYRNPVDVQVASAMAQRINNEPWRLTIRTRKLKKDGSFYQESSGWLEKSQRTDASPEVQSLIDSLLVLFGLTHDEVKVV